MTKKAYKDLSLVFIILIILLTALASYPSVMKYRSMYLDDMGRYDLALKNTIHPEIVKRNYFRAYVMYVAYELMTVDLRLARAFILLFMIASSLAFYFLLYKLLNLPPLVSFIASVLPNLLPNIVMIPSFIDGSYTVPGQFVLFSAIISGLFFLSNKKFRLSLLVMTGFLYFASIEMMDQSIFMIIPSLFIFAYKAKYKISIRLNTVYLIFIIPAVLKLYQYFSNNQASYRTAQNLSMTEIKVRFIKSINYVIPYNHDIDNISIIMSYLTIAVLVVGLCFYISGLFNKSGTFLQRIGFLEKDNDYNAFPVTLGVVWFVSSGAVYWLASPYFSNRYFHLPAFGVALFFAFTFNAAMSQTPSSKGLKWVGYGLLLLFLTTTVSVRYLRLNNVHSAENRSYNLLNNFLKQKEFPKDSQIIITGSTSIGTGGYWWYSSGFLKFLTNREDIDGVLSYKELQYYDAFRVQDRQFTMRMSGNDLGRPIFLYRIVSGNEILQMEYALRWKASRWTDGIPGSTDLGATEPNELRNSEWEVLKFDKITGEHHVYISGIGLETYNKYLQNIDSIEMDMSKILFNGKMTEKTQKRFGFDSINKNDLTTTTQTV